jgi:hypothetical protein
MSESAPIQQEAPMATPDQFGSGQLPSREELQKLDTGERSNWKLNDAGAVELEQTANAEHFSEIPERVREQLKQTGDAMETNALKLKRARQEATDRLALSDELHHESLGAEREALQARAEIRELFLQRAKIDKRVEAEMQKHTGLSANSQAMVREGLRKQYESEASQAATKKGEQVAAEHDAHIGKNGGVRNLDAIKMADIKERFGGGSDRAKAARAEQVKITDKRTNGDIARPDNVSWKDWYNASPSKRAELAATTPGVNDPNANPTPKPQPGSPKPTEPTNPGNIDPNRGTMSADAFNKVAGSIFGNNTTARPNVAPAGSPTSQGGPDLLPWETRRSDEITPKPTTPTPPTAEGKKPTQSEMFEGSEDPTEPIPKVTEKVDKDNGEINFNYPDYVDLNDPSRAAYVKDVSRIKANDRGILNPLRYTRGLANLVRSGGYKHPLPQSVYRNDAPNYSEDPNKLFVGGPWGGSYVDKDAIPGYDGNVRDYGGRIRNALFRSREEKMQAKVNEARDQVFADAEAEGSNVDIYGDDDRVDPEKLTAQIEKQLEPKKKEKEPGEEKQHLTEDDVDERTRRERRQDAREARRDEIWASVENDKAFLNDARVRAMTARAGEKVATPEELQAQEDSIRQDIEDAKEQRYWDLVQQDPTASARTGIYARRAGRGIANGLSTARNVLRRSRNS